MFSLFLKKDLCIIRETRRGGGEQRERNTDVWEKCCSVASHMHPQLGTRTPAQACALTRNWTGDLLLCGMTLNQLSHAGQGTNI